MKHEEFVERQNQLKFWCKRWLVLKDDKLSCYKSKDVNSKPSNIDLQQYSLVRSVNNNNNNNDKFIFELSSSNSKKSIRFATNSQISQLKWIRNISKIIKKDSEEKTIEPIKEEQIEMKFDDDKIGDLSKNYNNDNNEMEKRTYINCNKGNESGLKSIEDKRIKITNNNNNISWYNISKYIGLLMIDFGVKNILKYGTCFIYHIDKKKKQLYLLTAAHNLFHKKRGETAVQLLKPERIYFERRDVYNNLIPNNNYKYKTLHEYKIQYYIIHPNYQYNNNNSDEPNAYDMAILIAKDSDEYYYKLSTNDITNCCPELTKVLDVTSSWNNGLTVIGYPADSDKNGELWGMDNICNNDQISIKKLDGKNELITYANIVTSKGQSGSPIFLNVDNNNKQIHKVVGIHTGGWDDFNYGVILTKDKMNWVFNIMVNKNGNNPNYISQDFKEHIWRYQYLANYNRDVTYEIKLIEQSIDEKKKYWNNCIKQERFLRETINDAKGSEEMMKECENTKSTLQELYLKYAELLNEINCDDHYNRIIKVVETMCSN